MIVSLCEFNEFAFSSNVTYNFTPFEIHFTSDSKLGLLFLKSL